MPSDPQEIILEEENNITATIVFVAVRALEVDKAAGCEKFRSEMLQP